jgi:hypothetical protein
MYIVNPIPVGMKICAFIEKNLGRIGKAKHKNKKAAIYTAFNEIMTIPNPSFSIMIALCTCVQLVLYIC